MDIKWYSLHVYSSQERKVKEYLDHEIALQDMRERIPDIFVPQKTVIEMRNGKKVEKIKNQFPGYVLVNMTLDKETKHLVLNAPGVINFLGSQNSPIEVPQFEVDRFKESELKERGIKSVDIPFSIGDAVKVVDGPFNDFSGFVEDINPEKNKVKVMVSIFGRPTPVELDFLQVEQEK